MLGGTLNDRTGTLVIADNHLFSQSPAFVCFGTCSVYEKNNKSTAQIHIYNLDLEEIS